MINGDSAISIEFGNEINEDINNKIILSSLKDAIPGINAVSDEPMSNHTSFKIGGPADVFIAPKNEEEALGAIKF